MAIANYNSPFQTVTSDLTNALEKVTQKLAKANAHIIPIKVSVINHDLKIWI